MKKNLYISRFFGSILMIIFISGCHYMSDPIDQFNRLTPPIILVAKSKDGDITVCDRKKHYVNLDKTWSLAKAISYSYEKGDTLLFIKP